MFINGRFAFDGSSITKIHNHFIFDELLTIPNVACTDPLRKTGPHVYKLRSIICHVGQKPTHGHYTCYFRDDDLGWIFADDYVVTKVNWAEVRDQQAYILFYELQTSKYLERRYIRCRVSSRYQAESGIRSTMTVFRGGIRLPDVY